MLCNFHNACFKFMPLPMHEFRHAMIAFILLCKLSKIFQGFKDKPERRKEPFICLVLVSSLFNLRKKNSTKPNKLFKQFPSKMLNRANALFTEKLINPLKFA